MRKLWLLFVFMVFNAYLINAQEDWFFNSQNLIINIDVFSEANIILKSSDSSIQYIKVNLSHYPYESFNQEILEFSFKPDADIENNALLFDWQEPSEKINFGYSTKIKTNNNIVRVNKKIQFPLISLPDELKQFTQPQEIIDSDDDDIIELASKLVEGEDDMYVVVHKLAEWTKGNINYNLSTITAEASQKASWVLDNRLGVCDELTSLFIAMIRSVGIPAKFISGVVYTNSPLFPENWGSHGWAEVYFPGFGWIPYDVTYGQFGYIDPTHVKLKEALDSAEPSVQYKWLARNIELDTKKLDIDASVDKIIGRAKKPISLDVNILKENIGFGSYNLIEVALENLEDYYVSSEVYISRSTEVEITENFIRDILLKPKEKKSIFWTTKLTENLDENFIYTFPFTISTVRNFSNQISFKSTKNDIILSFDDVNDVLQQKKEEDQKTYSRDVNIDCNIDKNEFYEYEEALLQCTVKNLGNIFLENLNLCSDNECKEFNLGITQEKKFDFSVEELEEGKRELALNLRNKDVSKAEYLEVDVLDKPEIIIKDIEAPKEVSYESNFKIGFLLSKESRSNPQNVEIILYQNNFEKSFSVKELFDDRKLIINLLGKDLRKGTNEFSININYEDKNGKNYEATENFIVELANVTLIQNILLTGNFYLRGLENLTPQSILFVAIGSFVVFITVVWFVFRRKE